MNLNYARPSRKVRAAPARRLSARRRNIVATCGSDTILTTEYRGGTVAYHVDSVMSDGFDWSLGMTEPALLEPIDYDAEIAERRETHEPIRDVGGELGNSRFGV